MKTRTWWTRPGRLESRLLGAWPHLGLGLGFGLCTFSPSNQEGAWAHGRGDACLVWRLIGGCLPGGGAYGGCLPGVGAYGGMPAWCGGLPGAAHSPQYSIPTLFCALEWSSGVTLMLERHPGSHGPSMQTQQEEALPRPPFPDTPP